MPRCVVDMLSTVYVGDSVNHIHFCFTSAEPRPSRNAKRKSDPPRPAQSRNGRQSPHIARQIRSRSTSPLWVHSALDDRADLLRRFITNCHHSLYSLLDRRHGLHPEVSLHPSGLNTPASIDETRSDDCNSVPNCTELKTFLERRINQSLHQLSVTSHMSHSVCLASERYSSFVTFFTWRF